MALELDRRHQEDGRVDPQQVRRRQDQDPALVGPPVRCVCLDYARVPPGCALRAAGRRCTSGPWLTSSVVHAGTAAGLPPLAKFIYEFTERVYQPGTADFRTVINAGSTDAWGKIATTLSNPGDGILCEEWTYPSALACVSSLFTLARARAQQPTLPPSVRRSVWPSGLKPVTLPMDNEGMTPEGMDALLGSWNPDEHDGMQRCVHSLSLPRFERHLLPPPQPARGEGHSAS